MSIIKSLKRNLLISTAIFLLIIFVSSLLMNFLSTDSDDYVTRDEASYMLQFTLHTQDEWNKILDKNTSYKLKLSDVEYILNILSLNTYISVNDYTKSNDNSNISIEKWNEIYLKIVDILDINNYTNIKEFTVNSVDDGSIITDSGTYSCPYMHFDIKNGAVINAVVMDNKILSIIDSTVSNKDEDNTSSNNEQQDNSDINYSNIRVLLSDINSNTLFEQINITCTGKFTIQKDDSKKTYKAQKQVTISYDNFKDLTKPVKVTPQNKDDRIIISTFEKENSGYRGIIELQNHNNQIAVVNELYLEEYLYGVLPSEMPMDFGLEALKSQAVCARTYAYNSFNSTKYDDYKAQLDDTTSCQVYNSTLENDLSIQAVNETDSKVMTCNDQFIQCYYFSTSCGTTTDMTVWGDMSDYEYLTNHTLNQKSKSLNLTKTSDFKKFINNKKYDAYDNSSKWFRWTAYLEQQNFSDNINNAIKALISSSPQHIFKKNSKGEYVNDSAIKFGDISSIKVSQRVSGGAAYELEIIENSASIKITSEYNIRKVLGAAMSKIQLTDNSIITTMSVIPSGFFYIEKSKDNNYKLIGGGLGHGVGLSQYGAKGMADKGIGYEKILEFFFPKATVSTAEPRGN